jgi:hypothetical protein
MRTAYMATLTPIIPEYKPISIAHGVVIEGGKTLRMSGWPATGPNGIIAVERSGLGAIGACCYEHVISCSSRRRGTAAYPACRRMYACKRQRALQKLHVIRRGSSDSLIYLRILHMIQHIV